MSGGSFDYLYCKDAGQKVSGIVEYGERILGAIQNSIDRNEAHDMVGNVLRPLTEVEIVASQAVLQQLTSFIDRARALSQEVSKFDDVLHATEWFESGDYGSDQVIAVCVEHLEKILRVKLKEAK